MTTTARRTKTWLAATLAAAVAALTLTSVAACGSDDSYSPPAWGPTAQAAVTTPTGTAVPAGQATCLYIQTPQECATSGVPAPYWFQMPMTQPAQPVAVVVDRPDPWAAFIWSWWSWHLTYSLYYASPAYYTHYVPVSYRTVYMQHVHTFDTQYASVERTYQAKAVYRTSSGKTVPASKVRSTKFGSYRSGTGTSRSTKVCGYLAFPDKGSGGSSGSSRSGTPTRSGTSRTGVGGDRGTGGTSRRGC